ncbi:MAG: galactokinase [Acidimicrobiia bacterium]|nr:galactokinase [Acidimicrobiia bacterium]
MTTTAWAPGRVNLIGDHTDHTGGFVLPMAIDLGTTVVGNVTDDRFVRLSSDHDPATISLPVPVVDPARFEPVWGRYVAGVAAELELSTGFTGTVTTTLPVGSGLSSSASLLVATALALGADPSNHRELALMCQRAEQRAAGVPCGVMDHLAVVEGRAGHALLIDTSSLHVEPVPLPDDVEVVVVHSGEPRRLASSPYAERRARCEAAQAELGSLRSASLVDVEQIADPTVRAAARHVVTENQRVLAAADALRDGDVIEVGRLMTASHASLRHDLDVSTPALDALVHRLVATRGVYGARLTGAGFGGCVVALARPGAVTEGWVVRASGGAGLRRRR